MRRARSNTPLQALITLNEPLFLECARALALKTLNEGGGDDARRVQFAFRRCLSRSPSEAETAIFLKLLDKESRRFAAKDHNPWDSPGRSQ